MDGSDEAHSKQRDLIVLTFNVYNNFIGQINFPTIIMKGSWEQRKYDLVILRVSLRGIMRVIIPRFEQRMFC